MCPGKHRGEWLFTSYSPLFYAVELARLRPFSKPLTVWAGLSQPIAPLS